jgi:hypothetical protein
LPNASDHASFNDGRCAPLPSLGASAYGRRIGSSYRREGAGGTGGSEPFCEAHVGLCPDTQSHKNYEGDYVGHEPALLFYSNQAGSGNTNVWHLRIPRDAPVAPKQDGTGGTWNFQLRPTFWFGMALCESQSYPNPGSDANIKNSVLDLTPGGRGTDFHPRLAY